MSDTLKDDVKRYPLRPKRQTGEELPVRVNWIGGMPESQNGRARIGMGDSRMAQLRDEANASRATKAKKEDDDYKRQKMLAEALRK